MKTHRLLAVIGTTLAVLAVGVPATTASPWSRNCGPRDGLVLSNENYEVNGPFHIRMTHGEAIRLAARLGPGEFGDRATPGEMPCLIATSIGFAGGEAWVHWHGNSGWTKNVMTVGYSSINIGRFYCTGHFLRPPKVARETCSRGRIVVSFTIRDTHT